MDLGEARQAKGSGSRLPKKHKGLVETEVWGSDLEANPECPNKDEQVHLNSEWVDFLPSFASESLWLTHTNSY